LQGVAVCVADLEFRGINRGFARELGSVLQGVAGRCSVLPCVAVCCSVLQGVLQCGADLEFRSINRSFVRELGKCLQRPFPPVLYLLQNDWL